MAMTVSATPFNFLARSNEPLTVGARRVWVGALTGDNSYPTGGYTLDPSLIGLDAIGHVVAPPNASPGEFWVWNSSTKKMQSFAFAGTETPNTTDLSGIVGFFIIIGF